MGQPSKMRATSPTMLPLLLLKLSTQPSKTRATSLTTPLQSLKEDQPTSSISNSKTTLTTSLLQPTGVSQSTTEECSLSRKLATTDYSEYSKEKNQIYLRFRPELI